ncbi:hypothetical protein BHE74_00002014 [Ensete ventricosum]|nr:hypothetical protein GW17_00024388 [Ensete ventricosum]RWW89055.1 hypothetical protein BHE74_00002014 [Ensete ventricosum]
MEKPNSWIAHVEAFVDSARASNQQVAVFGLRPPFSFTNFKKLPLAFFPLPSLLVLVVMLVSSCWNFL